MVRQVSPQDLVIETQSFQICTPIGIARSGITSAIHEISDRLIIPQRGLRMHNQGRTRMQIRYTNLVVHGLGEGRCDLSLVDNCKNGQRV